MLVWVREKVQEVPWSLKPIRVGAVRVGIPLNFFGGVGLRWRPDPSAKKYKTFHPYPDGPDRAVAS